MNRILKVRSAVAAAALAAGLVALSAVASEVEHGAKMPPAQALGNTLADTVYTPLPNGRCNVAASAVVSSPLLAGTTRGIDTEDISSYSTQGGTGSSAGDGSINCGIPSFVTAAMVNVRVTSRGGAGNFRIFEAGQDYRSGSVVALGAGATVTSDVIVKSCQACAVELSIWSNTDVDYVINVIGYFMPPQATALDCVTTATSTLTVSAGGGTGNVTAANCPTGYTQTATNCETSSWLMPLVFHSVGTCSARNGDSTAQDVRASRTCCRVPGR